MKNILKISLLLLIALLMVTSTACNRNKNKATDNLVKKALNEDSAASNPLVKLPKSTFGFILLDGSTTSFKNFSESKLYQNSTLVKDLDGLIESFGKKNDSLSKFAELIKDVHSLKLLVGKTPEHSLQNIFFAYQLPENKQNKFGLLLTAKKSGQFNEKLVHLKALLEKNYLKVVETPLEGARLAEKKYTVSTKDSSRNFYITAGKMQLLISNDSSLDQRLFNDIKKEQQYDFQTALADDIESKLTISSHGLAFLDLSKLNLQIAEAGGKSAFVTSQVLSSLPEQLVLDLNMHNRTSAGNVYLKLNDEKLSEEIKNSLKSSSGDIWKRFASESVLNLSLNVGSIKELIKFAIKTAPDSAEKNELITQTAIINQLPDNSDVGLSLVNFNTTGLPDLQLILPSNNASEQANLLKQFVSSLAGSNGLQGLNWQSKQLTEGSKNVDYIVTPFGIGIYLTTGEKEILIGSSESAIKSLVNNNNPFQAPAEINFQTGSPFYNFYLDYRKLYRAAINVRNMLAMFLPQDPEVETFFKELEKLKDYGAVYADSKYENSVLTLRGSAFPIEKATAPAS